MKAYKTRKTSAVLLAACSIVSMASGCNGNVSSNIKPYVQANVPLTQSAAVVGAATLTFSGSIPFTETQYFTNYRTECDTVQCGTTEQQICNTTQNCRSTPPICTNDDVCRDVPDQVCHTGANGQQQCTSTTRRQCTTVQRCTGGGQVCIPSTVCHVEDVPQYCQENCRQVPFQDSRNIDHSSAVTVTVSGAGTTKIAELVLGVKTNNKYVAIFSNPSSKPAQIETLLKSLDAGDKTLLVLRAPGLKLAPGQEFLNLPANFQAGDPVSISLSLQADSSGDKVGLSALGSSVDFPALNWDTQQ